MQRLQKLSAPWWVTFKRLHLHGCHLFPASAASPASEVGERGLEKFVDDESLRRGVLSLRRTSCPDLPPPSKIPKMRFILSFC